MLPIEIIITVIIGCVSSFISAYLYFKGKNRALKEDMTSLESEKQNIITQNVKKIEQLKFQHSKEIEEVKKNISIEIENRKYRYETKYEQFSKFLDFLDDFNKKRAKIVTKELADPMVDFFEAQTFGDTEAFKNALKKFNRAGHAVYNRLFDDEITIISQINSIKLVSSPEIDTLLSECEKCVRASSKASREYVDYFTTDDFMRAPNAPNPFTSDCDKYGHLLMDFQNKLIIQMKSELSEI